MEAKSAGFLIISGSQTRARMRRSRVRSRRGRRYLGTLLRYMDRRAERDNHARQEQRRRNAAKNVGADFAFCFHGLHFSFATRWFSVGSGFDRNDVRIWACAIPIVGAHPVVIEGIRGQAGNFRLVVLPMSRFW